MIGTSYLPEGELTRTGETRAYTSSLDGLKRAMREGRILEGIAVRCSGDLTLTVEIGRFTGTIEHDEAVWTPGEPVKDIAIITRVGKPVCFRVISVTERVGMPVIKLSRRLAQRECAMNYLAGLTPGDIIAAKVTHLEHFGAFVDIGCGVPSLLPIDCISVSRIDHPAERLKVGCLMPVAVKSVERADGMPKRIYVTRRELLGTWEENAALFRVGQTITGIVRSIESYGVFIELTPNLAGLAEWRDDVTVGQTAAVYIKSIVPEKMKIKLVIVDPYRGISPRRQAFAGCFASFPPMPPLSDDDTESTVTSPDTETENSAPNRMPESSVPPENADFPEHTDEDCDAADGDISGNIAEALHISRWHYSPECCPRIIETVFADTDDAAESDDSTSAE